jgi:hypothetical protein
MKYYSTVLGKTTSNSIIYTVHTYILTPWSRVLLEKLILLGDLTFKGPCIVSISNKMQRYTVYLYLETALHVSVGTSTHH